MRKILLGTTGVVGAALIGMGAAQAQQAPTVRVGGFMYVMGMYQNDDADKNVRLGGAPSPVPVSGTLQNPVVPGGAAVLNAPTDVRPTGTRDKLDFRHELEVHVFVNGKAANGLSYGGVIEIQNDNSGASGAGSATDIDEAYVFVSSPTLGTIRFGEEDSAASLMQVRVPTFNGFGPDGDWDDSAITSAAATGTAPSLLTGVNDGSDATKIIYLSPQFFGVDFGLSFAPNQGEGERAWLGRNGDATAYLSRNALQRDKTTLRNEVSGALRYRGSFGNIGVAASFVAMRADAPVVNIGGAAVNDVSAYSAGLNVSGFGLTVGGEYTWGKYSGASVGRAALNRGLDNSSHWVLGATYVVGAVSLGGYYGVGTQDNGAGVQDREQRVWGLGVAYTLAPGMELLATYNSLNDKNGPVFQAGRNTRDLDVFMVGTRLAF